MPRYFMKMRASFMLIYCQGKLRATEIRYHKVVLDSAVGFHTTSKIPMKSWPIGEAGYSEIRFRRRRYVGVRGSDEELIRETCEDF